MWTLHRRRRRAQQMGITHTPPSRLAAVTWPACADSNNSGRSKVHTQLLPPAQRPLHPSCCLPVSVSSVSSREKDYHTVAVCSLAFLLSSPSGKSSLPVFLTRCQQLAADSPPTSKSNPTLLGRGKTMKSRLGYSCGNPILGSLAI